MRHREAKPLLVYLLSVVMVAALIGLAVGIPLAMGSFGAAREMGIRRAAGLAEVARSEIQRSLGSARIEVERVAEHFDGGYEEMCSEVNRRNGIFIGEASVLGNAGEMLCTTMPSDLAEVSTYRFQIWLSEARRARQPFMSRPFADPFLRQKSVAAIAPIRNQMKMVAAVVLVMPLAEISDAIKDMIAEGTSTALVLYQPDLDQVLSATGKFDPDLGEAPVESSGDSIQWLYEAPRLWAEADMPDRAWRMYAAVTDATLLASARQPLQRAALAFAVALAAGTLAALVVHRKLQAGIHAIADSARTREDRRVDGPRELKQAATALAEMLSSAAAGPGDRVVLVDAATGLGTKPRLLETLAEADTPLDVAVIEVASPRSESIAQVASELAARIPSAAALFRTSDLEFAITAPEGSLNEAVLADLLQPDWVAGIATPHDDGSGVPGAAAESMVRRAIAAMVEARSQGMSVATWNEDVAGRQSQRQTLHNEISVAIDAGEISVELIPVLDIRSGTIQGWRAAPRWPAKPKVDVTAVAEGAAVSAKLHASMAANLPADKDVILPVAVASLGGVLERLPKEGKVTLEVPSEEIGALAAAANLLSEDRIKWRARCDSASQAFDLLRNPGACAAISIGKGIIGHLGVSRVDSEICAALVRAAESLRIEILAIDVADHRQLSELHRLRVQLASASFLKPSLRLAKGSRFDLAVERGSRLVKTIRRKHGRTH